jgi:XTP/dITP diphosphohydrolase
MHFFLGTTNPHKVREFAALMAATGCSLSVTEPLDPDETEPDFLGNARLKARTYAAAAGGPTLCEDSGLTVAALGGLPGPWSARFSEHGSIDPVAGRVGAYCKSGLPREELDRRNLELVLELMQGVQQPRRAARFVAALVVAEPSGAILFERCSESQGWIADAARGEGGFGYDAIFVGQDTFGKTYAELDAARKNLRSHRRRVMQDFKMWLGQRLKRDSSPEELGP